MHFGEGRKRGVTIRPGALAAKLFAERAGVAVACPPRIPQRERRARDGK